MTSPEPIARVIAGENNLYIGTREFINEQDDIQRNRIYRYKFEASENPEKPELLGTFVEDETFDHAAGIPFEAFLDERLAELVPKTARFPIFTVDPLKILISNSNQESSISQWTEPGYLIKFSTGPVIIQEEDLQYAIEKSLCDECDNPISNVKLGQLHDINGHWLMPVVYDYGDFSSGLIIKEITSVSHNLVWEDTEKISAILKTGEFRSFPKSLPIIEDALAEYFISHAPALRDDNAFSNHYAPDINSIVWNGSNWLMSSRDSDDNFTVFTFKPGDDLPKVLTKRPTLSAFISEHGDRAHGRDLSPAKASILPINSTTALAWHDTDSVWLVRESYARPVFHPAPNDLQITLLNQEKVAFWMSNGSKVYIVDIQSLQKTGKTDAGYISHLNRTAGVVNDSYCGISLRDRP